MKKFFPFYKKMSKTETLEAKISESNEAMEVENSVNNNNDNNVTASNLHGSKSALDILSEVACNQDQSDNNQIQTQSLSQTQNQIILAKNLLADQQSNQNTNDIKIEQLDLNNLSQAQALQLNQLLNSNSDNIIQLNQLIQGQNSVNSSATLDVESTQGQSLQNLQNLQMGNVNVNVSSVLPSTTIQSSTDRKSVV